ncbi:MAG: LEA type 2 family protein [Bacteroidota bacterium]
MIPEKKKSYKWLIFPITLFILCAVGFYFFFNPKKALDLAVPQFDKIGHLSGKIENDKIILNTSVILTNKSPYTLDIDTLSVELKLGGKTLLKDTKTNIVDIRKGVTKEIPVVLTLDFKNIQKIIRGLQDQDSTDLELSINADYNTFLGHVSIPFTTTKRVAVPIPPKLKVVKLERKGFSFKDKIMDADVYLEVTNRGRLDMNIKELQYDIQLQDKLIESHGTYDKTITIRPGDKKTVVIPLKIRIEKPLKVYLMILRDKDVVPYTLKLKATVDENMLLKQTAPVEFFKEGVMELKKDKGKEDKGKDKDKKREKKKDKKG